VNGPPEDQFLTTALSRPHIRGEVSTARLAAERLLAIRRLYRNWPRAIAYRLGLGRHSRSVVFHLRSDFGPVPLIARANGYDVGTITEIWLVQLYDRLAEAALHRTESPTIVDIGANCGYFAVYAGLKYGALRVVCFEPEPTNRRLAHANLALNGVPCEVHGEAVIPDGSTSVSFYLSDDPRLHTAVPPAEAAGHGISGNRYSGRRLEVPAVNINDALAPLLETAPIDFLKIDVEGLDLDLVLAIESDVLAGIRNLSTETETRDPAEVVERLKLNGYQTVVDAGLVLASRDPAGPSVS
jgi:FkbM family methyltransferase